MIGPIQPMGDSSIDEARLIHAKEHILLVQNLTEDLIKVAESFESPYHSEKEIGKEVREGLLELYQRLEDVFEYGETDYNR